MVVFIAREVRFAIIFFPPNFLEHFQSSSNSKHAIFKVKCPSREQAQMREESRTCWEGKEAVQS